MGVDGSVYFDLNLRETITKGLQRARAVSSIVFGGIDRDVTKTKRGLDGLGTPIKLKIDTSDIDRAGRETESLYRKMQSGGSSAWSFMRGSLAAQGIMAGGRELLNVGRNALEQGMDVEKNIVGLSTFVGDKRAQDIYTRLQGISAHTPYTTNQLMPIERGLIAMGSSDRKAEKDMLALANAVAATGGSDWALERMGWHMTQIKASGRVEGMQRREFAIAGIPYDKLMADYLHINPGEVKGRKVSYDQLAGALDKASQKGGMFAGALEKLSQTIYGKWTTIKDFWQIGLAKMTLSQRGNIVNLEDKLIGAMTMFPEMIGRVTPIINRLFDTLNEVWPNIKEFGKSLFDVLKPIGGFLMGNEVKDLAKGMMDFSTALLKTPVLIDLVNAGLAALGGATQFVTGLFQNLKNTWNFYLHHDQYERDNDPSVMTGTRNGYMWGTLPAGAGKAGLVTDTAAMRHITDSLGANNFFADKKAMDDWQNGYMKQYYPQTQFLQNVLPLPYMFPGKNKKTAAGSNGIGADTTAASDAIVGGGQKVININFRNFTEHFTIQSNGSKEGAEQTYQYFVGMFRRLMRSLPT